MRIKQKFLIAIFFILILILSLSSYISFRFTEKAVIDNAMKSMGDDLLQKEALVYNFHEKASSNIRLAADYPVFKEFYNLPETKKGNAFDKDGVLVFTPKQKELQKMLEDWVYIVQTRFPIEETCLIDKTGQEHVRLTNRVVAPLTDFSSTENSSSFFIPAFELDEKNVHVEYPYMSPDALKWVFAYATPIVLEDKTKPAILHFEMPISFFQDLIRQGDSGRTYVIDKSGLIVADSTRTIDINLKEGKDSETQEFEDYMSSVYSISSSADFKALIEEMKSKKEGQGMFKDNGFTYYVVYKRLPTFGWSIAEVKSYSELLVGSSTLDTLRTNMIVLVILAVIASFIVISLIAESITRPLNELTDVANKLSVGEMNVALPVIKSKDEVYYLGEAIRSTQAAIEQLMGECYKRNSPKKEKKK